MYSKQHLLPLTIIAGLFGCEDKENKENTVNSAPLLNTVTITPNDNVITSSDLRCDTTATDPDNDPLNLTFQWTNQDGDLLSETRKLQLTPSTTRPLDIITCTATVTDNENSVQGTSLITVGNQAPVIESIHIEPNIARLGEEVQCLMTVTDPDIETPTTSITWQQNGTNVSSEPTLLLREDTFQKGDTITCTGTATDAYDGMQTESVTIDIQNTPPTFDSLFITPSLPTTQDTIECTPGGTFDIDDDAPSFAYRWFIDGTEQGNVESSISGDFSVGQTIQCEVTISDDEEDGNTLTAEATIQNTPPSIDTISLSPSILEADTFVECLSTVSDIDNQSTTLTHQWTVGSTVIGTESTLQLSPTIVEPEETIDCTITATDESGVSTSSTVATTIINSPPYWSAVASITGASLQGDILTCTAEALDINDGILSNQYEWILSDGTILSSAATWVVDTSIASPGEIVECSITSTDSDGASISNSTSITVENTPPTVVASLTPTMVYTDSTIAVIPQYSDADTTQTVTGNIEWHVVDSLTGSDNVVQAGTTTTLDGSHFNKGDMVYAIVTPNDGVENGVVATTGSVEVLNTLPSIPSISLTPSSPDIDSDDIVCQIESPSVDIDGDTIEYAFEWTLSDGSLIQSTLSQTLSDSLLSGTLLAPDTISCTVTPQDNEGVGPSATGIATGLYDCNCPTIGTQDYAYTYWPENFRYPNFNANGFHTTRHFVTGHYGFTMDMTTGSILNLGQSPIVQTMAETASSSDDWVNTALSLEVEYGIEVNGVYAEATDFINPDQTGIHASNNPSMLMDMGRFVQHIEVPEVMYTGNTNITGSLGIVSAPQHFVLTHRVQSSTNLNGTITVITKLGGDLFTQVQDFQYLDGTRAVEIEDTDGVHWLFVAPNATDALEQLSDGTIQVSRTVSSLNTGEALSIPILVAPSEYMTSEQIDFYLAPDDTATVSYAQMNQSDTFTTGTQTALWNPEFGCFEINLGSIQGSGAAANSANWHNGTDFNIYNRHQITVEHSSTDDLHIPLFFDGPINTTFNITGGSPLFRSMNEEPTGIPIQVSKNWHIPGYWPNWFHMYSTPTFPSGSHPFELTVAIGKWGETFAASHAQLSLVGWGTNQQWDESALGAWGESITYDPDKTLRRAMVDDVRPFLMEVNGQYNWTGNVGGADFLKYRNANNQEQQPIRLKSTYNAPGPVMTDVVYSGITADEAIQFSAQTHLVRTDDIVRAYYVLQYDFLEDVEYSRLGLFQIAADNYSDNGFTKYAYGDSTGVLFDGTVPNHNATGYASNADRGIELTGEHPWVFLYDSTKTGGNLPEHVADVGFIVRDYNATINGTMVSNPHINIQRTRNGGWSQMAFELGIPFDASDTFIEAGSSIHAIVEYIVVPNDMTLYYGTSTDLLSVDSTWFGTTDIIEQLASSNTISATATIGTVLQEHPTIIEGISDDIAAEFELIGGFGYSPITIGGLFRPDGWRLEAYENGSWIAVDQSVHDNDYWQTSFNPENETYALTFSVETNSPTTFRLNR